MNDGEFVELLSRIHPLNKKGSTKYGILKQIGLSYTKNNYKKLEKCIEMGFLKQINYKDINNPPLFISDKDRIWNFFKRNSAARSILAVQEDHSIVLS